MSKAGSVVLGYFALILRQASFFIAGKDQRLHAAQ